jgi:hypothetical protein
VKYLIKIVFLLFVFCVSGLQSNHALAVSAGDEGKIFDAGFRASACYHLSDVSFQSDGYIKNTFSYEHLRGCKREIFYAETVPKGKIRGVFGVKGTVTGDSFSIIVEPNVKQLNIEMAGSLGRLARRKFDLTKYISAAKRQNSGWQEAWKQSEQTLEDAISSDKTAPKIVLHSPDVTPARQVFRVDTYQTFVRGKASDDQGVATVLVNGKKAGVKADGSFAKKVKLAFGTNQMKIQAEDIHGNVAERTFIIIREEFIPDEVIADVDIPKKTRMNNPDGIGVVIGVESYQYVADATYAYNDAEVFREYLADTLGYKKSKIKISTNSKATQAELNKLLGPNGWIARNVKANKSDVVVYFSGHGIPDAKTKKTGLLPFDVDPNYSIGLTLRDLYRTLGSLNARSVTVFLDTCFSGQGREKQTLLADTRGIQIVPKERNVPGNISVLSAATAGQVSGPIKAKEHGLFTYYLLKGLGGVADSDKNKKLTMSELGKYVHSKVKEDAAIVGREQTPELQGVGGRVLVAW